MPLTPAEKQKRAELAAATFESLFGEAIRRAKATLGTRDDLELASGLLSAAKNAKDQLEMLSLTAWAAADLAGKIPEGYAIAIEALQLIADKMSDERSAALEELVNLCQLAYSRSRGADRDKAAERLMEATASFGDDRAEAGDFVKAAAAYRRALDAAAAAKKSSEQPSIQARYQYASSRQTIMVQIDRLAKQLESTPTDTSAREELIRLTLVELDAPDRAARFLDPKADDLRSKLILLAGMTPGNLPEAACLQLGDWYAALADQGSPPARVIMLGRARTYYSVFLEKHGPPDLQKTQVTIALRTVEDKITRISPKPRIPAGAVLVLTFDRSSVTTQGLLYVMRDQSPQGNHGILHGGTLAKGVVGDAMTFGGVKDYIDCGSKPSLQITGDETIAFWIMPARFAARTNPFSKNYSTDGAITLEPTGHLTYYYGHAVVGGATYAAFATSAPIEAGVWTHVALVRDFTNKKFMWYRNGKKTDESKPAFPAVSPSNSPLQIGTGYVGPFPGRLDELAVFSRALTDKEVQLLFEMGQKGVSLGGR